MKKIFYLLVCLIFLLGITGCKEKDNGKDKNNDKDKEKPVVVPIDVTPFEEVETWIKEQIPDVYDSNFKLPTAYKDSDKVTISWVSSNPKVLAENGTLPRIETKIKDVDLTYTITNEAGEQKSSSLTVTIYPKPFDSISNAFINQFPTTISESMDYIKTDYFTEYKVTWESSNQKLFTNNGEYIKPNQDESITINFRITASNGVYKEYSFEIMVAFASDEEKIEFISNWLYTEKFADLEITSDLDLPSIFQEYHTELSWETSNQDVVDIAGKVHRFVYDRYVELRCTIKSNSVTKELSFWIIVKALDISKMTETEILENFIDSIAVSSLSSLNFRAYSNISQSFNALNFFDGKEVVRNEYIAPLNNPSGENNRPGIIKKSTEFIVVHDTANTGATATAYQHAKYVSAGGGGTSFHYVVGNDGIYHLIPDNEVAYHAGDGTRPYELLDTGIKATVARPNIGINSEGYFTFNNVASLVHIPDNAPTNAQITSSGVFFEIGENGNYWINRMYYNTTYKFLSNFGGNRSSIGIETCVNQGTDYIKTLHYNAKLVATLLIENNLDVTRVLQHNNMSGKPCPLAIREAKYWQTFRDMVSLEKFGLEHFKNKTFEWIGTDILSSEGYIKRGFTETTTINYSVAIKDNNQVIFTKDLKTTLIK